MIPMHDRLEANEYVCACACMLVRVYVCVYGCKYIICTCINGWIIVYILHTDLLWETK